MGKGSKKKPLNSVKPQSAVTTPPPANMPGGVVWFNLCDSKWMTSVKTKQFTNFLKNVAEYSENHFHIFRVIVPKVMTEWKSILAGGYYYRHCHQLDGEQKEIAQSVYSEIFKRKLGEDVDIWQFGFIGSVRLVCIRDEQNNSLIPIFVDHHHLINDSEKYNQPDYDHHTYCAICEDAK